MLAEIIQISAFNHLNSFWCLGDFERDVLRKTKGLS